MTTSPVAKKDIQKLQRAIVDGLENVKAVDVVVFDTEHLSALFERVIIASGSSNRQTKALASSVRDAVREAGFPKPRMEGEGNGEWIIVDCAQAVVHIMQPNFRQYYHLEELWGERPVRLKLGAAKPVVPAKAAAVGTKEKAPTTLKRASAAKKGVAEAFPSKAQVKKNMAAKSAATGSAGAKPATAKSASPKAPAAKTAVTKSAPAKSVPSKRVATQAAPSRIAKPSAAAPKKTATQPATKPAMKSAPAKKATARKA
ncbi:ribosome silencing factor [Rhodoferax sp.]|jgi:ribosome-associated protein|uniref:ribosome silencing factor n=1 Tax=Rhodoferax sp. TaxID=50421 RepID=UPI0037849E65